MVVVVVVVVGGGGGRVESEMSWLEKISGICSRGLDWSQGARSKGKSLLRGMKSGTTGFLVWYIISELLFDQTFSLISLLHLLHSNRFQGRTDSSRSGQLIKIHAWWLHSRNNNAGLVLFFYAIKPCIIHLRQHTFFSVLLLLITKTIALKHLYTRNHDHDFVKFPELWCRSPWTLVPVKAWG